jgi:hypothetical protein
MGKIPSSQKIDLGFFRGRREELEGLQKTEINILILKKSLEIQQKGKAWDWWGMGGLD